MRLRTTYIIHLLAHWTKYVHGITYIDTYWLIVYHLVWNMRVVLVSSDTLERPLAGTFEPSTFDTSSHYITPIWPRCIYQEWVLTARSDIFLSNSLAIQISSSHYHASTVALRLFSYIIWFQSLCSWLSCRIYSFSNWFCQDLHQGTIRVKHPMHFSLKRSVEGRFDLAIDAQRTVPS